MISCNAFDGKNQEKKQKNKNQKKWKTFMSFQNLIKFLFS